MTSGLGRLRQVSMGVEDLDRAVAFYRDVLGLRLIARFGDLAFFDLDGIRLLLGTEGGAGGSVLYLAVDHIHAARTELEAKGVDFIGEPHSIFTDAEGTFGSPGETEWLAFFRDSEGNTLALSCRSDRTL